MLTCFPIREFLAILGKIHDDAIIYTDLYMKVAKGRQALIQERT